MMEKLQKLCVSSSLSLSLYMSHYQSWTIRIRRGNVSLYVENSCKFIEGMVQKELLLREMSRE